MNWWQVLRGRRQLDDDLAAEIQQHLEEHVAELRAQGMGQREAERMARLRFGNPVALAERSREVWRWPHLEAIVADVRIAFRQLRRAPAFTFTAILTLAVGVGINGALFSLARHVLLEPLPFPHPDQLVAVWASSPLAGSDRIPASGPDFLDYLEQNHSFSSLAQFIPLFTFTWSGDGDARLVNCTSVSEHFFPMLGLRPLLGRLYVPREYTYLDNDTVVISERFWRRQLGGDPHVIGRTIGFEGQSETIVGVLPSMPDLGPETDVWPKHLIHPSWDYQKWRENKFLRVIGRLKPGVTLEAAAADLTAILRRAPGEPKDVRVRVVPLRDDVVGSARSSLRVLMASVGLVLLVACVNVAALLRARGVKRRAELALRMSLGAGYRRIAQQLVTEDLILVSCGLVAGLVSAVVLIPLLTHLGLPRLEGVRLDAGVLAVVAAIATCTTLAFGTLPLLARWDSDLARSLRSGRATLGRSHRRPFSGLVVGEIACAIVLAIGAGLLIRSLWRLQRVDPGFVPESMLTVYLRTNDYTATGMPFWKGVLDGVSALPGVRSAAFGDCVPGRTAANATLLFDDRPNDRRRPATAQGCWISSEFFRTAGTRLLRGSLFTGYEDANSSPVVLVNARAARRYWPGKDPIGRWIAVNYTGPGRVGSDRPRMRQVVGVVEDIRQGSLDTPPEPSVYMPYLQDETFHDMGTMRLYLRSSGDPAVLNRVVRATIHGVNPNQPVEDLATMTSVVGESLAPRRMALLLLGILAGLAVLLAALGVYGVAAYTTSYRTQEFGLRIALGATRRDVVGAVLGEALVLTAIGSVVGGLLALLATPWLGTLLFEVRPFDAPTFLAAGSGLGLIAIVACGQPAWRASRTDPSRALRID